MKSIEYWYRLFRKVPAPKKLVVIPHKDFELSFLREQKILKEFGFENNNECLRVTPPTLDALYIVKGELKDEERLVIESAYRTPELLTALWVRRLDEVRDRFPKFDERQRIEFASKYTASPMHLGNPPHSRGDAVDVALLKQGKTIKLAENNSSYEMMEYGYFRIRNSAIHANRKRLRDVMISGGFIPYDQEYWHFGLSPVFLEGDSQ